MMGKLGSKWLGILLACVMVVLSVPQTIWATEGDPAAVPEPTPTPIPIETNQIAGWPQGPEISAKSAVLLDANTGAILYNKNMTERMYPASTTKIMTALIALENSSLDEIVTFTETGVAEAYSGSSNLFTQVGETFTMEECLYALLLKSANDFASQIAEHVGGSVENFVQMMNDKAAELGCVNTHFNNAHGLPDENHYSCAYDLALIMQEVSKNETYCKISGTEIYTISETELTGARTFDNHNALIKLGGPRYYEGVIAGKTGYTDAARNTFVSVCERNGMRLIEATMSSPVSDESFINAQILYDYGFSSFQNLSVQEGNEAYSWSLATVPVGMTADVVTVEAGEIYETPQGQIANEIYSYSGHVIGSATVSQDYLARLEEEAPIKTSEEDFEEVQDPVTDTDLQTEQERFDQQLKTTFRMIMIVLIVCIIIGLILIFMAVLRRKRRRNSIASRRKKNNY